MRKFRKQWMALGLAVLTAGMFMITGCQNKGDSSGGSTQASGTGTGSGGAGSTDTGDNGAKTETSGEPVTLTYWHHDASDNIVTPLKKMIADFEAENPDIKIDFLALPADNFYQKYVTAVATNTAPDIFGVRDTELLALVNQNAIISLDDYVNQWEEKDDIPESIWESVNSYTDDGRTYMIPSYMNACIMWYNTQKMGELGIEIPTTIDEFLKDCETYANPAENSYFYSLRGGAGSYDNLFIFLMSYAGADGFFDEEGNCVLNQDVFAEAMDLYAGIYKNGWVSRDSVTNSYKEMVAEFGSGISMSMSHNSTSATNHQENLGKGNFTNAIHPSGKNGKTAIPVPSIIGAAVTTQSQHPAEAARFVEYLASHEAASYFCEKAGKTPVNDLAYQDEWCQADPYMDKYAELMSSEDVVLYNNPIWLTEWTSFTGQDVVADFQAVLMGEKESKPVLNEWAEKLTSYQKEYMKNR
ncbi:MAG: sugar ABC transporter substrate-binding protein [Lachnospiraceae bacterium]|nr:sugar ABC transporter substrate-binding protein [Lachnospiraceae bacterium]